MLLDFGTASLITRGTFFSTEDMDGCSLMLNGIRYRTKPVGPDDPEPIRNES
jgi:hypothetical protein